ncbi:hypothetical protein Q3G72_035166 [Acer saccharum]|nr:hypothetical protein Q3G72_035166 [Acer saccharum]
MSMVANTISGKFWRTTILIIGDKQTHRRTMKLMIQIQCKFLKERNDGTSTANKVPRAKTTFKEIKMLEFTPKANIDHFMKEKWKFRK